VSLTVYDRGMDESTEDVGTIAQLNHEGDIQYTWDQKNPTECTAAKEYFDTLLAKGFLAFKITRVGLKGKRAKEFSEKTGGYHFTAPEEAPEMAREFDPKADYVVSPQMTGG
jgi:hypothetical protein